MHKPLTQKLDSIRKKTLHLIEQNHKLVLKNENLAGEIKTLKGLLEDEARKNDELNNQIKIIKLARNISSANGDNNQSAELKRKINEYIKEIDHCIKMLND